jgi:leucyl aminopeptidase
MTAPLEIVFEPADVSLVPELPGQVAILAGGGLDPLARRVDRLTRGAVTRLLASEAWGKAEEGEGLVLGMPHGLAAESLIVVKRPKRFGRQAARKAGAWIARTMRQAPLALLAANSPVAADLAYGLALRAYAFEVYKTRKEGESGPAPRVRVLVQDPETASAAAAAHAALVEGVFFARDLTNEPANVLTTTEFAARLGALQDLGLKVEILAEDEIARLGMRALLAVAQGSASPARVVVMQWNGAGEDAAPFALLGKGVCFDSGGISMKPAAGMEEMTMDMGGAAVVAGVMRALALRKARANVVGIVGLVENMPDGKAQRPGDIVRSMKGDTVEVINTDAEGRLVLADVLWYAQDRFKPAAIVDLATLTGAVIIALGHENAGVFSNDDVLAEAFLKAAAEEGEGAWRLPLGTAYDRKLKSRLADMKNVGGRPGGAITAAQFLKRFVTEGTPWVHLDIAGVASVSEDTDFAPKGATGWGVRSLDRLIRNRYES